ncbi:MAG: hypothetical protein ACJ795_06070 [Ktedonobacteraceae bacterium]
MCGFQWYQAGSTSSEDSATGCPTVIAQDDIELLPMPSRAIQRGKVADYRQRLSQIILDASRQGQHQQFQGEFLAESFSGLEIYLTVWGKTPVAPL